MSEMIRVKVRLAEGTETYHITRTDNEDEGRYFCRVSNTFGTKEVFVDVKMLGWLTSISAPLPCFSPSPATVSLQLQAYAASAPVE